MSRDLWGDMPDRRWASWVLLCALLCFAFGVLMYLLSGYGHFFAFGLLSVGLVGWLRGRRWGLAAGFGVAVFATIVMLIRGIALDIVTRDNLMYLAIAVALGAGVGELADINRALRAANREIRQLRGFIPICASCKNVRDDQGYWTEVEDYVSRHTQAEFTHGLCPSCTEGMIADLESSASHPVLTVH